MESDVLREKTLLRFDCLYARRAASRKPWAKVDLAVELAWLLEILDPELKALGVPQLSRVHTARALRAAFQAWEADEA